jgi:hypothetical protein
MVDVVNLMLTREVDHETARLILYALRMASSNQPRTSFPPDSENRQPLPCQPPLQAQPT